ENPPPSPVQASLPNSGTLIHRTFNALIFAKPNACIGNVLRSRSQELGFRSVHAGAIFGSPALKSGTFALLLASPFPNVTFPFEFRKNPFPTHTPVPIGPPNRNSNPPDNAPASTGFPAPLSSSPRNGAF